MASLQVNPCVPLGRFNKIETKQRRTKVSMHTHKSHKPSIGSISASSLSLSNPLLPSSTNKIAKNDYPKNEKSILSRNLDEWTKSSMVDIVKNLKQAPLLVHVYADEDERGQERTPMIKTEKAILEKWPIMKNEWENGKRRTPDGLIFVQELKDDDEEEDINQDSKIGNFTEDSEDDELTKSWGVIVQGKGKEFGPACYLLKTSRVRAGRGMDLFCTHFCLVRVKNFRESALKQFKGCWL